MSWWATVKASTLAATVGPAVAVVTLGGGAALLTDDSAAQRSGSSEVIAEPIAVSGDGGQPVAQESCTNEGDTGTGTECASSEPLAVSGDGSGSPCGTNDGIGGDCSGTGDAQVTDQQVSCAIGEEFRRDAAPPPSCPPDTIVTPTTTLPPPPPPPAVSTTTLPPPCAKYDITGVWPTESGNGYHATFDLQQFGTELVGSATLAAGEYERAGYKPVPGTVAGSMIGDQVILDVTWLKADEGALTGRYTGTVTTNAINGSAGPFAWSGTGMTICIGF
jgi:hypothetical protein